MSLRSFDDRMARALARGQHVGLQGGRIEPTEDGHGVTIHAPVARGAALLVHGRRSPDFDEDLRPICTKCRFSRDIVLALDFPGGQGEQIHICRDCMNRPTGNPLAIKFES